jgi:hypothetical protein
MCGSFDPSSRMSPAVNPLADLVWASGQVLQLSDELGSVLMVDSATRMRRDSGSQAAASCEGPAPALAGRAGAGGPGAAARGGGGGGAPGRGGGGGGGGGGGCGGTAAWRHCREGGTTRRTSSS